MRLPSGSGCKMSSVQSLPQPRAIGKTSMVASDKESQDLADRSRIGGERRLRAGTRMITSVGPLPSNISLKSRGAFSDVVQSAGDTRRLAPAKCLRKPGSKIANGDEVMRERLPLRNRPAWKGVCVYSFSAQAVFQVPRWAGARQP